MYGHGTVPEAILLAAIPGEWIKNIDGDLPVQEISQFFKARRTEGGGKLGADLGQR